MEEIEKFTLSMEESVAALEAQMQEQAQSMNAKMEAIKALIAEKKKDIANAKNGIEGRVWSVGDVILSDGTIIDAANIDDADEEDLEKADSIVCAVKQEGKKAYVIKAKEPVYKGRVGVVMGGGLVSIEDLKPIEDDLESIEKEWKTERYPSGWKIPSIVMLREIYENKDEINKILEYVNAQGLWAVYSSRKHDDREFCEIDFNSGSQCTTSNWGSSKRHSDYSFILIHGV